MLHRRILFLAAIVLGVVVPNHPATIPFTGKVYEQTVYKAKGVNYLAKVFTLPEYLRPEQLYQHLLSTMLIRS